MDFSAFSLEHWLYYLEHSHQQEIQLGLARITEVAKKLELLQWNIPIITVTGTNGKGSTVTALEEIYTVAGYNVGTYTSPHLLYFNERIRVNAEPITDKHLCDAFLIIEKAREDITLTYFEVATLAALWYFRQSTLDIIILEVGIGGRLDATNIIDPDLAIITTIDLDHQDYLGHTKEDIGYEKAGILREKKYFIYADKNPPESVLKQAMALNAPTFRLGVDYTIETSTDTLEIGLCEQLQIAKGSYPEKLKLPLPNIHQNAAAAAIIASICLMNELPLTAAALTQAMHNVEILGRRQVVKDTITTIYDVAHNPQAASLLAEFTEQYNPKGNVHAVFSGLKDKDLCGLIKPMLSCVDVWYPAKLSGKRAASETQLLHALSPGANSVSSCYSDPIAAYHAAMSAAKAGDIIVVYGSFLTVGAIMAANRKALGELQ